MYEVGSWYIYLMDGAILAILAFILMVFVFIKRGKYQKEAEKCIRAEVHLPTGWNEFHTVPCDLNAKSVTIKDFVYVLDPDHRRFDKHPRNPFLGLGMLQVPIRVQSWYQDNSEPIREEKNCSKPIVTAAEVKAMVREIQATEAGMMIQEVEAQQKELVKAIGNQPNKAVVYILLIVAIIASIVSAVISYQGS